MSMIFMLWLFFTLWYLLKQKDFKVSLFLVLAFIFFNFYALQISLSGVVNTEIVSSDIFEIIRPINYFLMASVGYLYFKLKVVNLDELIKIISYCVFFTALLSSVSLLLFDSLGSLLMSFYAKESLIDSRRFAGTFNNPYDFAFMFSLSYSYFLCLFIINGGWKKLVYIFVLLTALLFSQSKSGFGVFLISTFLISTLTPFFLSGENVKKSMVRVRLACIYILTIFLILLFFIYLSESFSYLYNGIIRLFEAGGDTSTKIRIQQFLFYLELAEMHPGRAIIGFGSSKGEDWLFESLYSLYLFRYGIFGFVLIFALALAPLILIFISIFQRKKLCSEPMKLVLAIFFVSLFFTALGNNVIDQNRLSFPFFIVVGFIFSSFSSKVRRVNLLGSYAAK